MCPERFVLWLHSGSAPEPDDVERKCPRRTRSLNSQHTSQNSKAKTVETLAERDFVPLDHSPPGYAT